MGFIKLVSWGRGVIIKTCSKCGASNDESAGFCKACSAKLENEGIKVETKKINKDFNNKRNFKIYMSIALAAAILIPSSLFFIFRSGNKAVISNTQSQVEGSKENTEENKSPEVSQNTPKPIPTTEKTPAQPPVQLPIKTEDKGSGIKKAGETQHPVMPVKKYSTLPYNTSKVKYIIPDSGYRRLTEAELEGAEVWQLAIARNEIYARHGYSFNTSQYIIYFMYKDWYHEDKGYKGKLSEVESYNIKLLLKMEEEKISSIKSSQLISGREAMNILSRHEGISIIRPEYYNENETVEIYGEKFYIMSMYIFYEDEGDAVYIVSQSTGNIYIYDVAGNIALLD